MEVVELVHLAAKMFAANLRECTNSSEVAEFDLADFDFDTDFDIDLVVDTIGVVVLVVDFVVVVEFVAVEFVAVDFVAVVVEDTAEAEEHCTEMELLFLELHRWEYFSLVEEEVPAIGLWREAVSVVQYTQAGLLHQ